MSIILSKFDSTSRRRAVCTWVLPALIGCGFLGPGLWPGALINLDLIVLPHLEVPAGFWGLGPELPRQVPLWVFIGALSNLISATVIVKLFLIATFTVAWAGMVRWAGRCGVQSVYIAAALYAFSPFVLTRIAVGHLGIVLATALIPWVAPILIAPFKNWHQVFLASALLSLCGYYGGIVALLMSTVSALTYHARDVRRNIALIASSLGAQSLWLVPSALVSTSTTVRPATAAAFGVGIGDGPVDILGLSTGIGFWNRFYEVGATGFWTTLVGAIFLALALTGSRRLPKNVRTQVTTLGILTWALVSLSAWSWTDGLRSSASGSLVGAVLREPHRLLSLHLFWLTPSACLGVELLSYRLRNTRRFVAVGNVVATLPIASLLFISVPGFWGLQGHFVATPVPASWTTAREIIRDAPGPTLALPWTQYLNLELEGQPVRRVLDPIPYLLGGDVLRSSDNRLGNEVQEAGDPRESVVKPSIEALVNRGEPLSPTLERLGIRWVVLQHVTNLSEKYDPLYQDVGLNLVFRDRFLSVFATTSWKGMATNEDGDMLPVTTNNRIFYRISGEVDSSGVLARPASKGWFQGWTPLSATSDGLLALPRGAGTVWNIATPIALATHLIFVLTVLRLAVKEITSNKKFKPLLTSEVSAVSSN